MGFKIVGISEQNKFPDRVEDRLSAEFAKVSAVSDLADAVETKADKSVVDPIVDAVNEGRLSDASINNLFGNLTRDILAIERGTPYDVKQFSTIQNVQRDRISKNAKFVVLGDSHANGGYTAYKEQAFFQRIAFRSGATSYNRIEDVSAAPPSGVRWYTGAIGGYNSSNYVPQSVVDKIAIVNPDFVFHFIGSNDWSNAVPIATFKSNVLGAISRIDAVVPNAVHILIHGQGRRDVSPAIPWANYGAGLSEIAAADTVKRRFINTEDAFNRLGLLTDNYAGLVLPDKTHMGNVGHKYMADIISQYLGLPIETRFDTGADLIHLPIPIKDYTAIETASKASIPRTFYPRSVEINGSIYINTPSNQSEIAFGIFGDGVFHSRSDFRIGATGSARSVPVSATLYIPPAKDIEIQIIFIPVNGSINTSGSVASYNNVRASIRPA